MTARLLPLPDDPRAAAFMENAVEVWNDGRTYQRLLWPRSAWLHDVEQGLLAYFPQSSSRDRSLTARHYAPFPLAAGHDVP